MKDYIVQTESGKIRGYERNGMIEFLGIPYAQPPVGELRMKRAQPVKPWEGVFDAKAYGAPSVQPGREGPLGSEDCLTLNVRRPLEGENLPVLVFIHGGGYNTGMASDSLLEGSSFVKNGIVYISIQYRLNVWGFYDFSTYPGGEDFDTNCGISDHIVAMKWIHENVRSFGGDPDRITISGESAGGISVVTMMAIPELQGTFQQAISSSALPNANFTAEMSRKNMDLFLEGMGWTEADIPKLKTVDAYDVLKGNDHVGKKHQYRNPGIFLPAPAIDDLLPEKPIDAIRKGSGKGIKLMIGTNLHEGSMFVREQDTNFPNSWEMIEEMFRNNGHADAFGKIKAYYEARNKIKIHGIEEAFINFATDYAFQVPALKIAQAQSQYGDVWMYRFEYISEMAKKLGIMCDHAMDLPCDFNTLDHGFAQFIFKDDPIEQARRIMEEVHMSWVRFVKTGNPNEAQWPKFEGYGSPVRIFDKESRTERLDRTELMEVWGEIRFYE